MLQICFSSIHLLRLLYYHHYFLIRYTGKESNDLDTVEAVGVGSNNYTQYVHIDQIILDNKEVESQFRPKDIAPHRLMKEVLRNAKSARVQFSSLDDSPQKQKSGLLRQSRIIIGRWTIL